MFEGDRRRSWSGGFSSTELGDWEKFSDSFFFCNFPDSCELKDLWRVFNKVGKVLDVFISKRRTQKGSRFGFVRFRKGNNINKVEADLQDIWFGSYRLRANKSKFIRNSSSSKENSRLDNPATSPEKVLTKETSAELPKHLESLKLDSTEKDWLSRCLVGELKNDALFKNIGALLNMENFSISSVKSLGGRLVLLECSSIESRNKLLESLDCYNQWFAWIQLWSPKFSRAGRIVKLNCFGVPLQAWNKQNFHKIGELVGEVVEVEEGTINKLNLLYGTVLIFTNDWSTISQMIDIQVDNKKFSVLVREELLLQNDFKDFRVGISDRASHYSSSEGFVSDSGDEELPDYLSPAFSDDEVDQMEDVQRSLNAFGSGAELKNHVDFENGDKVERESFCHKSSTKIAKLEGSNSHFPAGGPLNVSSFTPSQILGDPTGPIPLIDPDSIIKDKEVGHNKTDIHTTGESRTEEEGEFEPTEKDKEHDPLSEMVSIVEPPKKDEEHEPLSGTPSKLEALRVNMGMKKNNGRRRKKGTRFTTRKRKPKDKGRVEIVAPEINGVSISDDGIRNMARILKNASVSPVQSKNSEDLEKTLLLAKDLGVKFDNIKDEELADLFRC